MAGRSGKPGTRAAPPAHVEDTELFAFSFDCDAPPSSGPRSGKIPAAQSKAHYHEHRARLRRRLDAAGAEALSDYELLELYLFRTIPRQDTKPLAKALLERFGTLAGVLAAPAHLVEKVDGAGPAVAQDLKTAHVLFARTGRSELKHRTVISSSAALLSYCQRSMAHAPREQFRVLFLDSKNQLIADEVLNEGTVDHAPVYPREVARRALEHSAAAVILVHNHPSGDPKPSAADIAITEEIVDAARAVSVKVHDHLVVGRNGAASFKSLGLL
jgi:DNA repair protein RadC